MLELGIERLSVFGLPPPQFVALASELGCTAIGLAAVSPTGFNPHGYAAWSLRDDAALRRETRTMLDAAGVRIALLEGFAVMPGKPLDARYARDMDLAAELGCARIAAVSLDQDLGRTIEGFAQLAQMAAERGLALSAEMGSLGPYARVPEALAVADGVGAGNFSLMVDAMHFLLLGNTPADLAAMPPGVIGYAQLCDATWARRFDTYLEEAMHERLPPGAGELPLAGFLAGLPDGITVGLEVPQRSLALAGVPPKERLAPCVAAARALIAASR